VNTQFGQLFPKLFGGGEARLIMTARRSSTRACR